MDWLMARLNNKYGGTKPKHKSYEDLTFERDSSNEDDVLDSVVLDEIKPEEGKPEEGKPEKVKLDDTIKAGFQFKPVNVELKQRSMSLNDAGSYVALTLIGKPQSQQAKSPDYVSKLTPTPIFLENPSAPTSPYVPSDRVTAPRPVDARKSRELIHQKLDTIKAMHEQALREYEDLRNNQDRDYSPQKIKSILEEKLKTVKTLERMKVDLLDSHQDSASQDTLTSRDSFIISEDNTSMDDSGYSPQSLAHPKRGISKHAKSDSVPVTIYKSSQWSSSKSITRSNSDAQSKQRKFLKNSSGSSSRPTRSESERSEAFSLPSTADAGSHSDSPLNSPSGSPTPLHLRNRPISESLDEVTDISGHNQPMKSQLEVICTEDDELLSEEVHMDTHSTFSDLSKVEKKPAYMAVLLHYLISNSDPAPLFFYTISDSFSNATGGTKDLRKWAYEIFSVFLVPKAPLRVEMDEHIVSNIDDALMVRYDKEDYLRNIFVTARDIASETCKVLLEDFNHKGDLGLGNIYGLHELQDNLTKAAETNIIEKYLMPHFERLQKLIGDRDGGDQGTERNHAMSAALVWFLRQSGFKSNGSIERCPSFVAKEKRSKLAWYTKKNVNVKAHQFVATHYMHTTPCNFCGEIIVGVGYQGYQCTSCELNYHRQCIPSIEDTCLKRKSKRISLIGDKLRRPTTSVSTSQLILPPKQEEKDKENKEVTSPSMPQVFEIKTLEFDTDPDLGKFSEQGHSVTNLVQRYDCVTTPEGDALTKVSDVGRSESLKGRNDNKPARDIGQRRAKSDLEFDDNSKVLNNSGSSSASSLSASISVETFSDVKHLVVDDDSDFDVEPELPPTKQFVSEDVYKKLKPKEKKRLDVINELFYTERTHVRNLKVLDKIFFKPMTQEANIPPQLVTCLFPNLEEIIELHGTLNRSMKCRRAETPILTEVGDLLLNRFDGEAGSQFRDKCAIFCRNQSYALDLLKQKQRRDERVSKFLLELESNALCRRLQLKDLIPTVVHRLTKYPLLIENLCKYTQSSTEEHVKLEQALQCSRHILNYVNQAVRECENHQRLVDLNRHIDRKQLENQEMLAEFKSLDLTQHKFLREGPLVWRVSGQKLIPLHVVLLQDLLVLFQKQDDKLLLKCQSTQVVSGKEDTKYTHSPVICLTNLLTRNVATDKKGFFLVNTSNLGPQIYELNASSSDDRNQWFKAITDAADNNKRREAASSPISVPPESQLAHGDPDQITLVRSQISVGPKAKRPSSTFSDSGLPPYSSSPERSELDSPYDQLGLTQISDVSVSGLIEPDEVTVTDTYIARAQSVLTPLEKLRRNDEKIREGLLERENLISEILGLDISVLTVSETEDDQLDNGRGARDLVASSIQHASCLMSVLTNDISSTDDTYQHIVNQIPSEEESSSGESTGASTGAATQHRNMPQCLDKVRLAKMANRMNEILTNLMAVVNTKEDERERLRDELRTAHEQLNLLRTQHIPTITRQRPSSMVSVGSSGSYGLDDPEDGVMLVRLGSRHCERDESFQRGEENSETRATDQSFDEADHFEEALAFLPGSDASQTTPTSDQVEISPTFESFGDHSDTDAPNANDPHVRADKTDTHTPDVANGFVCRDNERNSGNTSNSSLDTLLSNVQPDEGDVNCNTDTESTSRPGYSDDKIADLTEDDERSRISGYV